MSEFWQGFVTHYLLLGGTVGLSLLVYGVATSGAKNIFEAAIAVSVGLIICVLVTVLWPAAMMIATGISIAEKRQEKGMR